MKIVTDIKEQVISPHVKRNYFKSESSQIHLYMIKYFLASVIILSVIVLLGCNQSSKNQENPAVSATAIDSIVKDGHSSSNSLDMEGEYIGTIPCADCEGIETKIILNKDRTFIKQTKYLGKSEKVIEEKGSFTWNKDGNTIIFSGIINAPNQYFVGENKLIQLDINGNKIIGKLAEKYELHK